MENNIKGAVIGLLTTTDEDAEDSHTYQLVIGEGDADNASFTIEGNALKAAQTFDYEAKNSFIIRLQTKDKGNLTYETTQIITIKDIEDVVTGLPEEDDPRLKAFPKGKFLKKLYRLYG